MVGLFKGESQIIPPSDSNHSASSNCASQTQAPHPQTQTKTQTDPQTQTDAQTKAEREKASAEEVKRRRELAKEREGREMFRSFDQDGDGHVDEKELADVMNGIGRSRLSFASVWVNYLRFCGGV